MANSQCTDYSGRIVAWIFIFWSKNNVVLNISLNWGPALVNWCLWMSSVWSSPNVIVCGQGVAGDTFLASDWSLARLSGFWLADTGHDRVQQVSVSPGQGAGVLWNLEIIREESAVQCHLTMGKIIMRRRMNFPHFYFHFCPITKRRLHSRRKINSY